MTATIDIFNNDERILINGICKNENLAGLNRSNVLCSLRFSRAVANEDDAMLIGLLDGVLSKMEGMTDDEWNDIKMLVPFAIIEATDDEPSEEDEEA